MEELNKGYEFTRAQIAELESLRAWKAEIEKQEPVASIQHINGVPSIAWSHRLIAHLPNNTKLYAAPVVSPDVEMLELCIIRWKGLYKRESDLYDKLNNENQSLKTELEGERAAALNYRNDAIEAGKKCDGLVAALNFARQGYQAAYENGDPDEIEWAEMYLRSIDAAIEQAKGGVK